MIRVEADVRIHDPELRRKLDQILTRLDSMETNIMSAIGNLTDKVTALEVASAAEKAEVQLVLDALKAGNTANDPALNALSDRLQAVVDGTVATTALEAAAIAPPAPPAPPVV